MKLPVEYRWQKIELCNFYCKHSPWIIIIIKPTKLNLQGK